MCSFHEVTRGTHVGKDIVKSLEDMKCDEFNYKVSLPMNALIISK